jgi:DNA-binding CsgD family transcriptional regulator
MDDKESPSDALVEPLTRREQAMLLHLAGDKSYREIAAQEVLALNSVKWYIRQLYGKLGVNNRRQALERARSLGLLPTAPQALRAAIAGQRALRAAPWNELGPLRVRMGWHTGEAQLDPGGDEYAVSHVKYWMSQRLPDAGKKGRG